MDETFFSQLKFSHPLFELSPFSRSLVRIISYASLVIALGAAVSLFISDYEPLRWGGALLIIFLLDILIHFRKAPRSLAELFAKKVVENNMALCTDREGISVFLHAYEKVEIMGGSLSLALLISCAEKPAVRKALERLDVSFEEFHSRAEDEYEASLKDGRLGKEQLAVVCRDLAVRATRIARFHSRDEIGVSSLFPAACAMPDSRIAKILDLFTVKPEDVDAAIIFGEFASSRAPRATGGFAMIRARKKKHRVNRSFTSRPTPFLDAFSRDLTDMVRLEGAGFLVGHEREYDQMKDILSRPGNRNVIMVGEPGIGKEAILLRLAFDIVNDTVPETLFDRRLVELSLGSLISGAATDELSTRLQRVVKEILSAGNIIMAIPDIHLLSKTASVAQGIDLSDILTPIIKSNLFPVVGMTYPKEYKEFIELRSDFASSFEMVRVQEISQQEAIALLSYDALVYERQYGVTVSFSAVKQAVALAAKYFRIKPLPSSAQDLLKETLADATQKKSRRVSGMHVINIAERKVNIPIHKAGESEAKELLRLEEVIHEKLINQEEAVKAVASSLRAYRSGLSRKNGPIASFLFIGPTGVGKTELSKRLAEIQFGSEKFLIRFDMSEYQQKESIVRFIGSPDGKIAGALTETVIQKPYSLILLDEFEKMHPDLFNLFLQVFDEGRLTDSLGRVVDFQNTIIIATSNAHSVYIQEHVRAGTPMKEIGEELKKKLTEYFRPELINRFSDIIVFSPLSLEHIKQIAKLQLKSLSSALQEAQGISLECDDAVVEKISSLGYDPTFGARPLRKAIDNALKNTLVKKILSGELSRGQRIKAVLLEDGSFDFVIQ